jgi:sporadic carbohydrate cluster 2OG-Fe(II) oxygenase
MKSNILGCNRYNIESPDSFQYIKSIIDEVVALQFPGAAGDIANLHHHVNLDELNFLRLKIFKKINSNTQVYDKLWDIGGVQISKLLGPDVLVQTKINLSIQMPNDVSSTLGMHSDCWSGDSPYQINLWIPLTNCFSSNSMFLFDFNRTKLVISDLYKNLDEPNFELSNYIKQDDFLDMRVGEFLIFNPGLLHGNVINRTESTRVSINVRYKSLFTPDAKPENVSRGAGIFFKIYKESAWSKLAKDLDGINYGE